MGGGKGKGSKGGKGGGKGSKGGRGGSWYDEGPPESVLREYPPFTCFAKAGVVTIAPPLTIVTF